MGRLLGPFVAAVLAAVVVGEFNEELLRYIFLAACHTMKNLRNRNL